MYKNIVPIIIGDNLTRDEMVFRAITRAKEWGYLRAGDVLVVVEGGRLTQGDIPQLGAFQLVHVE
jgi:pyruvate kinase